MLRGLLLTGAFVASSVPAAWGNPQPPALRPGELCRAAIAVVEREARLPPNLLNAIATVESGRADPASGRLVSWPWALNAEGAGRFFGSQPEAVAAARQLLERGVKLIDTGCLQVNLFHHPDAFASLDEAFDPLANARYAAGFLKRLHAISGDWVVAAGHYHSQTTSRADLYRMRVLAAWAGRAPAAPQIDRAAQRREDLANAWTAGGTGMALRAAAPVGRTRSTPDPLAMMADAWTRGGSVTRLPASPPSMR